MNVRRIALYGVCIALCVIGGHIHVGIYSIAFDALPAFVGAMVLGPTAGAVLGGLGHAVTAATSNYPLGPVLHGVVGIIMALTGYAIGRIIHGKKLSSWSSYVWGGIVGYSINVILGLAMTILITNNIALGALLWVPLSVTYGVNYVGAALVASQWIRLSRRKSSCNEI